MAWSDQPKSEEKGHELILGDNDNHIKPATEKFSDESAPLRRLGSPFGTKAKEYPKRVMYLYGCGRHLLHCISSCPSISECTSCSGCSRLAAGPLGLGLGKGLIPGVPSIATVSSQRAAINHVAPAAPIAAAPLAVAAPIVLAGNGLITNGLIGNGLVSNGLVVNGIHELLEKESLPTELQLLLWLLEPVFSELPFVLVLENSVLELPLALDSAKQFCKPNRT
ncbi:hypothetical protein TNCT_94651 [Trichonephila clavata]|uniref:Uncharacterized protein n=1 Tax=Trichonephila clavata TaxID=2740835 RepID=A0A8X6KHX8_TRICU|nr:hypothetical protein TNCT_94651 [Trichonephila clavata]